MKKRQGAVDVATFLAIFFIVLRLLTHAISNFALQAMEKVPDVSRNSARCSICNVSLFICSAHQQTTMQSCVASVTYAADTGQRYIFVFHAQRRHFINNMASVRYMVSKWITKSTKSSI